MAIDREAQVLSDATASGIRSPRELANFMAQVTHESKGLSRLEESFRYTKGIAQIPVESAWRQGTQALESARKEALQGKPEKLAELMYGGRNGNDQPGDGYLFRGRGYIQLTGKANYLAAGKALALDLVRHPELAAEPEHASKIAAWYWTNRVPESAREDVKAATKAVNGKYNGLEDRRERFAAWEKRLTPEVMERLEKGNLGQPVGSPAHVGTAAKAAVTAGVLLAEGSRGDDVRHLQAGLSSMGYKDTADRPLRADGEYGPTTRTAVKAFQRDRGLTTDGVAGPDTLIAMAQQLEVIEATQDALIPDAPPPRHGHHHHHPHAPVYVAPIVLNLDHPTHPQHGLYMQAREAVHRLDAEHQRTPDQRSDNLAAALTVAAHREGLTRVDSVALSDDASRTYAVQGEHASPLKRVAEVQTQQAVVTPPEKSAETLQQMAQKAAPDPAQPQPTQPPHNPAQNV